ncbi:hypothetical protein EBT31_18025 [bacterium]|jgi:hypothetical protein|nr:hypothetical protein [bacterium]
MAEQPQPHVTAVAQHATQLFERLRQRYVTDARTPHVLRVWSGRVADSPVRNLVAFERGTLIVGTWCPQRDTAARWRTRLIMALAKASVSDSLCAGTTAWLLQIVTNELGWDCEVDCDACYETGVCLQKDCPKCTWHLENCTNKFVWPELLGRPAWVAQMVLKAMHPTKRVVMDPFDMLYQTPANPDVIRIVYDSRTGLVVTPAPYVTSSPEVSSPREACYLSPAEGLCVGAPPNPPPATWKSVVGHRLGDVMIWLREQYPHAVIEPVPASKVLSRDLRHDRIRIRFDPDTKVVTHVPTVG